MPLVHFSVMKNINNSNALLLKKKKLIAIESFLFQAFCYFYYDLNLVTKFIQRSRNFFEVKFEVNMK